MDLHLSSEQEMVRKTVQEFMETEVAPIAHEIDQTHAFPEKTARRMGELGLMGMTVPPEYGGAGVDNVTFALATEEITRICASHSVIFGANNSLTCGPINAFGTHEQKETFLRPLAEGREFGAYALTEPGAGSDAANLRTKAELDGDEWVLDGQKTFITNGAVADTTVVFARTEDVPGPKGVSAFIVRGKETDGVTVGENMDKMGLRASCTNEIFFDNARIPKENLLGDRGQGFTIAMATLDGGRIMAAAGSTGILRACYEESLAYSKQRKQFGKPIGNNQAIQWKVADIATHYEAARLMYLRAATLKDAGQPYTKEASIAKVFASERAMDATIQNIQVHGGNGYTTDYPAERHFRDIKIFEIFEGTSEVQRLVIGRHVLA